MTILYSTVTIFSVNSISGIDPLQKLDRVGKLNESYEFIVNIIPKKSCEKNKPYILITNAFDKRKRAKGWGLEKDVYGLSSKVYYGGCTITQTGFNEDLTIDEQSEILENIEYIVSDEAKLKLAENSFIKNLNLSSWREYIFNDCKGNWPGGGQCPLKIYEK